MTLQQLRYVIAVDRYRSFSQAAEACEVTQPTLSGMLVRLEEELDVRIFDRTNKRVTPTAIGERIIRQAEKVVAEAERIAEIVQEAKGSVSGRLAICISPGIAPYVMPSFIRIYLNDYPEVDLAIEEMKASSMVDALRKGTADCGIATAGHAADGIYEKGVPCEPPTNIEDFRQKLLEELVKARRSAGLSQKQLEILSGVPQTCIARTEKGTTDPQLTTLLKLLEPLGLTLSITGI